MRLKLLCLILFVAAAAAFAGDGGFRETYDSDTLVITTTGQEALFARIDTFIVVGSVRQPDRIKFQIIGGEWMEVVPPYQKYKIIKRSF